VRKLLEVVKRQEADSGLNKRLSARALREREAWVRRWVAEKRDLTGRVNGTIDPYYGCYQSLMLGDYALNFSMPWSECASRIGRGGSVADIFSSFDYQAPRRQRRSMRLRMAMRPLMFVSQYNFLSFQSYLLPSSFITYLMPESPVSSLTQQPFSMVVFSFPLHAEIDPNVHVLFHALDEITRSALHAPTSKNWTLLTSYPFNNTFDFRKSCSNGMRASSLFSVISLPAATSINPFGDPSKSS
jgi:hypothetical protein